MSLIRLIPVALMLATGCATWRQEPRAEPPETVVWNEPAPDPRECGRAPCPPRKAGERRPSGVRGDTLDPTARQR